MVKTYLVNPPNKGMLEGFPGSLLFLQSWLARRSPETSVDYLDLTKNSVGYPLDGQRAAIKYYLDQQQLVPGALYAITATTATYQNALQTAQAIKKIDPHSTIILGGHHAMHQSELILNSHPEIDYCALGEGEKTLEDLVNQLPLNQVRGIAYRSNESIILQKAGFLTKDELDQYQFDTFDWSPVYDTLHEHTVRGQFGYLDISTARGCNLKCTFCTFGEDQLRDMSPSKKAQLLEDLAHSKLITHAKGVNIHDNDFAQNSRRTHELCDLLTEKGITMDWTIQTRVEHLNDKNKSLVEKLAKTGCKEVYLGVENFDPDLIKYLKHVQNPYHYLQNTQEAVANALTYDIGCNINLQLGVPGETQNSRQHNLEAIQKIAETAQQINSEYNQDNRVTIYPQLSVAYPGTAMAKLPIRGTNYFLPETAFEDFTQWEWAKEQSKTVEYLGENFAHGNGGIPLGLIDIERFVHKREVIIKPEKLEAVNSYLDAMHAIAQQHPVLRVFNYKDHLER